MAAIATADDILIVLAKEVDILHGSNVAVSSVDAGMRCAGYVGFNTFPKIAAIKVGTP
jgi:hypothetical protein